MPRSSSSSSPRRHHRGASARNPARKTYDRSCPDCRGAGRYVRTLSVPREVACPGCGGAGSRRYPSYRWGTGQVFCCAAEDPERPGRAVAVSAAVSAAGRGRRQQQPDPACASCGPGGPGFYFWGMCKACQGEGRYTESRTETKIVEDCGCGV